MEKTEIMTGFIYQQWCMLLQHSYSDLLIVKQVKSKFFVEGKLLDTLPAIVGNPRKAIHQHCIDKVRFK